MANVNVGSTTTTTTFTTAKVHLIVHWISLFLSSSAIPVTAFRSQPSNSLPSSSLPPPILPFAPPASQTTTMTMTMTMTPSSSRQQPPQNLNYPRPLHPGGFALPPLEEDFFPIATATPSRPPSGATADGPHPTLRRRLLQTDLLIVKPPDPESLWEWYAYTKRTTDRDPSWGRIWPTALSLARFMLLALEVEVDKEVEVELELESIEMERPTRQSAVLRNAIRALQTSSHVVELGCGLGVAGLALASSLAPPSPSSDDEVHDENIDEIATADEIIANSPNSSTDDVRNAAIAPTAKHPRTITFLDREPYALHCAMASASANRFVTAPIGVEPPTEPADDDGADNAAASAVTTPIVTIRAAVDDWTLPGHGTADDDSSATIKNMRYADLKLDDPKNDNNTRNTYQNDETILIATDILYESSSVKALASKLSDLVHPTRGGYALLADPEKERTPQCRDAFLRAVEELGGEVAVMPMPSSDSLAVSLAGGGTSSADALEGMEWPDAFEGTGGLTRGTNRYPLVVESDVDIGGSLAKTVLILVHFGGGGKCK